jgi:hypothetical protein
MRRAPEPEILPPLRGRTAADDYWPSGMPKNVMGGSCWADRVAIALFGAVTLFALLLGMGNPESGTGPWWGLLFAAEADLALKIVLPVWLMLRLVDFCAGGPQRRRRDRERGL